MAHQLVLLLLVHVAIGGSVGRRAIAVVVIGTVVAVAVVVRAI